jgi:methylmalonyl-CoA/ethylmalonyl-CoA epimerase
MKLGRLNHVGVATPSIERSVAMYREWMGAEVVGDAFDLPAQGCACASSIRRIARSS